MSVSGQAAAAAVAAAAARRSSGGSTATIDRRSSTLSTTSSCSSAASSGMYSVGAAGGSSGTSMSLSAVAGGDAALLGLRFVAVRLTSQVFSIKLATWPSPLGEVQVRAPWREDMGDAVQDTDAAKELCVGDILVGVNGTYVGHQSARDIGRLLAEAEAKLPVTLLFARLARSMQTSPIVWKAGQLHKQGNNFLGTWSRRYFHLTCKQVAYYNDKRVNAKKLTGVVPVSSITKVCEAPGSAHFRIETGSRKYLLYAPSRKTRMEWMFALKVAQLVGNDDNLANVLCTSLLVDAPSTSSAHALAAAAAAIDAAAAAATPTSGYADGTAGAGQGAGQGVGAAHQKQQQQPAHAGKQSLGREASVTTIAGGAGSGAGMAYCPGQGSPQSGRGGSTITDASSTSSGLHSSSGGCGDSGGSGSSGAAQAGLGAGQAAGAAACRTYQVPQQFTEDMFDTLYSQYASVDDDTSRRIVSVDLSSMLQDYLLQQGHGEDAYRLAAKQETFTDIVQDWDKDSNVAAALDAQAGIIKDDLLSNEALPRLPVAISASNSTAHDNAGYYTVPSSARRADSDDPAADPRRTANLLGTGAAARSTSKRLLALVTQDPGGQSG